jgi:plastocyanin
MDRLAQNKEGTMLRPRALIRSSALIVTLVASLALIPRPAQAANAGVYIQQYHFTPFYLVVPQGSTVTWQNFDPTQHTVTSDYGVWDSGPVSGGSTYQYTFKSPGVYPYYCKFHSYMNGAVIVYPTASTPPGPTVVVPTSVTAGSTSVLTGGGFAPNNWVFVRWQRPDGSASGMWVLTDIYGAFSLPLGFDRKYGCGTETIMAYSLATSSWTSAWSITVTC